MAAPFRPLKLICLNKPDQPDNKYELGDIFRLYGQDYLSDHKVSTQQLKVMQAIAGCRTGALGAHLFKCDKCGHTEMYPDSCRNRHCPTCQGAARMKWLKKRINELLDVPYYHVVFTLPHLLNPLVLYNKKLLYGILFKACSQTLKEFGQDPEKLGAKTGFFGILHTWDQTMGLHPHLHVVFPGGGFSLDSKSWVELPYEDKFLFWAPAMSLKFRGIFIDLLKKAYYDGRLVLPDDMSDLSYHYAFEIFVDKLVARKWVIYVKKPFAGPHQVLEYVGRYTHKVAISNHRIISIRDGKVTFNYKDNKDKDENDKPKVKIMTLSAEEFIRRFLLHILPIGFHKIRAYGFLANGCRKQNIALARELIGPDHKVTSRITEFMKQVIEKLESHQGPSCPVCEEGTMKMANSCKIWLTGNSYLVLSDTS